MPDDELFARITALTDEEHELERAHRSTPLLGEDLQRLDDVRVSLDQCWDLLRQRRARREFGQDPEDASVRSVETVEGYEQ